MASGAGLTGSQSLTWKVAKPPSGAAPRSVVLGSDPAGLALQVAVADWTGTGSPTREALAALYKARLGKHVFPLVVLAGTSQQAWMLGPSPDAAVIGPLPRGQAERLLQAALDEPTGLAARQRLATMQKAVESTALPGVVNTGLFATYYLTDSVPQRPDWAAQRERSRPWMPERGERLIRAMGFTAKKAAGSALLLTGGSDAPHAVAVLLDASEQFDQSSPRYQVSPVAWGLQVAARNEVPWLMVLRGSQIRLYPAKPGVGVGRKGQVETWFELDLALLGDDEAGLLGLVFSADALAPDGTVDELLAGSKQYATALGERLRDRIYVDVVPTLATAVADQLPGLGVLLDQDGLDRSYKLTLRILFRLLFQAYAEDRGLLPYRRNQRYDRNALKTVADDLVDNPDQEFDPESRSLWDDLQQVWRVIDSGDTAWNVPAYNGGLFGSDPVLRPDGAFLARLALTNDVIGPVLRGLLVDATGDGTVGAVDFRSLSVREFGTIYEGLLESTLSVAPDDLTVDAKGRWVPAKRGDTVEVPAGQVYFHSASGERKATGSYFTPDVVVEHLLDRALEPVLTHHLARVQSLLDGRDEAGAAAAFFDLRVADLAMGSGHFLVAAVDRIEARMRNFLTEHPIPPVTAELRRLQAKAEQALGDDAAVADIEPAALLRRQIARRCIYGIDVNPLAVELARLGLWITTFVPGLPMSSLDHGLVCADSLTGVGTLDEALAVLDPAATHGTISLFAQHITDELADAKTLLQDAAASAEADKAEVHTATETALLARQAAEPARRLFDAVVAARLGLLDPAAYLDPAHLIAAVKRPEIAATVDKLRPAHMPFLFPEVFLRDNPGFDCLLGNPPWEEVMVEEPKFWLRVEPGLFALKPAALKKRIGDLRTARPDLLPSLQEEIDRAAATRAVLLAGPFPGLGVGDVDYYRVFAWRNWQLLRQAGHLGMIFPRSLLNAAGNAEWREHLLSQAALSVVTLLNANSWVFPIHPQYSFALVHVERRRVDDPKISLAGPFASEAEFLDGKDQPGAVPVSLIRAAASGASLPQLPSAESADVFTQLRKAPRLDERSAAWDFRPVAEFHATNDRKTFDSGEGEGRWPVYGGTAFNIWAPDTGEYYAWANPPKVTAALQAKRKRQAGNSRTAYYGLPPSTINHPDTLPCTRPRIAFRDITRATDTRTLIAALVPGHRVLTNKAPYLLSRAGDERTEAFLLGVLSSLVLDWYSRRYVEIGMSIGFFNSLPSPRPVAGSLLAGRVTEIAGMLASNDARFSDWAVAVGVPVGSVTTPKQKDDLIAELDALVALLYGLSQPQLEHVFATFHRGWDYRPRLDAVVSHYAAWRDKA